MSAVGKPAGREQRVITPSEASAKRRGFFHPEEKRGTGKTELFAEIFGKWSFLSVFPFPPPSYMLQFSLPRRDFYARIFARCLYRDPFRRSFDRP
jgi:hypothetical protein